MVWAEKMMADIMRVGYFGRSFGKDGLRNRKNIYINMEVIKTDIEGVLIIEPRLFRDARGLFLREL